MKIREASFALRVVRRTGGDAAIIYRRDLDAQHRERLTRLSAISPLAFTAAAPLLRAAVRATSGSQATLAAGPFHPLDADWGTRVACYALVAAGLREPQRLTRAAQHLAQADGSEAGWWLGLLTNSHGDRALRALRILVEAVK
ncbi:MAG: hypothetical protein ABSA04_07810 [Desulfobaccales bacterium]|jgi:hypothetical protein